MSYTYATLPVSRTEFEKIKAKLIAAGYDKYQQVDDKLIDMHGIALVPEKEDGKQEYTEAAGWVSEAASDKASQEGRVFGPAEINEEAFLRP